MRDAVRASVEEVLETMFFAETMGECPAVDPAEEPPPDEIAAGLTFQGEPSGCMLLRITLDAARQITADFLGLDDAEISDNQISEVVRELANMICGSVLSRVESSVTFQLGPPRVVRPSAEIIRSLAPTTYGVRLTNGRLRVNIGTESPICLQLAPSAY